MIKVTAVIVHYMNTHDTDACLKSISRSDLSGIRLNVELICNSSAKDLMLKHHKFPVSLTVNSRNEGFAKASNTGLGNAYARGDDWALMLNNDIQVEKNTLRNLIGFAVKNPGIGCLSPKIYFAPGYEYHPGRYNKDEKGKVLWYCGGMIDWRNVYAFHRGVDQVDRRQFDRIEETDFATGCCMLVSRKTMEKVGFLDKNYYMYYEDADYSQKVKKFGFKVMYYPGSYLWHKNAASSDKPGSDLHVYYQTRNRLYFGMRYAGVRAKKSLIAEGFRFFLGGGIRRKAFTDFILGRMGEKHD